MKEYNFTLKFNFPDARIDPDRYIEQLYESGCDDALIGISKQGCIAILRAPQHQLLKLFIVQYSMSNLLD